MLLRHAWLASLMKPPSISEDDEDAEASASTLDPETPTTADKEVSEWVVRAMERRRTGQAGKGQKPALHAAPLDAMSSPSSEQADSLD